MKCCFASQPFKWGQMNKGNPVQVQMNYEAAWKNKKWLLSLKEGCTATGMPYIGRCRRTVASATGRHPHLLDARTKTRYPP